MAIPGFDKTFYLNAKLEQLQSDSATAADWAGKDVAFLEARLLNGFGLTAEAHYEQYGYQEDLAPNAFFNPAEYIRAKATDMFNDPASSYLTIDEAAADFVSIWNGNVYNHYLQYGEGENINPSNSFDVSAYLETKLADLQAKEATAAEWAGKSVADVAAAFKASGLTALEHFTKFGQDEGLSAPAVPAEEQVEVDTSVPGQVFSLTAGVDDFSGTANNDTFKSVIDGTTGAVATTLTALDTIDGANGTDSLSINVLNGTGVANTAVTALPTISLSSIETINLRAAVDLTADLSGYADVTTINSTQGAALDLTASTTADVNVSGATGAITVDGGKKVVVSDNNANANITIGDTTESAGSVSVTDTKQGTGNITVEGGTDVTVAATVAATTADVAGGTINVGNNTDQPTGAISVTQTNTSSGARIGAAVQEQQTLTFTADDVANGNEELTINIDANSGGALDGAFTVDLSAVDTTDVSAVATKVASDIDAITGVSASAAGGVVTITYDATNGNNAADTTATVSADTSAGLGVTVDADARAPSAISNVDLTAGAINVQGGTTIDVDVNSTSTAATSTADGDIINGTVTATAGDNTTSINIAQDLTANTNTKAATDLVGGTSTVTFKALASGETVTVAGLTFAAAKDLTAEEVAQAFADLTAVDTQSNGTVAQGTYTNDVDASITSGSANGASVVFTNTAGAAAPTLALASSAGASLPTAVTATGTAAVAAVTSSNSVTAGAVTANDNATASVTDITLSSFGTATLGTTNGFDALVNLTLTDSNGTTTLDTAATSLTMNVNDVMNNVSIDSGAATVTDLTINTSGAKSDFDLTAAAVTDLTVAGNQDLTLAGSTLSALETVSISGAGAVALGDISGTVTAVNASTATGGISATVDGTKAVVTTGTGNDSITVDTAGISKAINLGEGDDTLTLSAATATVPTAAVNGGAGTDTIAMTSASAESLDGNTNFDTAISGFERLAITNALATSADVNLETLGFDYVTLEAGSAGAATLSNLANNGTVALEAALGGALAVNIKDAATGTADVLNLIVEGDSTIAAGTVTADDVETLNIAANDVFVDSSTPKDGKDNNNAVHTLTANGDSVESIVVTGDDLGLTTDSTVLTSVDASALTGGLTYTANGAAAGTTVTGGAGADNLTASGSNDVLIGGAGNDTLTGANLSQLTGGEGADTFVLNAPSSVNAYSTITDLEAGDTIDLGDGIVFKSAAVDLADTAVFQDYANQAINDLATNEATWFQFGGNTFVVADVGADNGTSFNNGQDAIIQITGLVDLSTASYNQTAGTLEIA
jgi:S-layer protein